MQELPHRRLKCRFERADGPERPAREVCKKEEFILEGKDEGSAGELKGKVLRFASLLDYQPGAVVSRELVKGKSGTVSVFAFDAGEGLSEHTAPPGRG
jgi:quercetin dioxygenase-like cupin family protein